MIPNYEPPSVVTINYVASPTLAQFHRSDDRYRGVRGPIGSGKSVGCCFEIFKRMQLQAPGPDGIRKTRWAIVRNTYPELKTTTLNTWLDWFPENIFGKLTRSTPMVHNIKYNDVEAEVLFLALDNDADVKKLLSLELTGVWINEAREVPLNIVLTCGDRVGRYPSKRRGGPSWYGVIMDTNSPEEDHWWCIYEGLLPWPEDWEEAYGWKMFTQPPAAFERKINGKTHWELNPKAENLANLPDDYYSNVMSGKPYSHIRVYVGNQPGTLDEGKAVYGNEYSADVHLATEPFDFIPGLTIWVGIDGGRNPAALFGQQDQLGIWRIPHEFATFDTGPTTFAKALVRDIAKVVPDARDIRFFGDPSGEYGGDNTDKSFFDILKANGVPIKSAGTNDQMIRKEAMRNPLNRLIEGKPGVIVSPKCMYFKAGMAGKYMYRKLQVSGSVRYSDQPEKNKWSHIVEAGEYMMLGGGEGSLAVGKEWNYKKTRKASRAKTGFNPLKRRSLARQQ